MKALRLTIDAPLGRVLRSLLRVIPPSARVPILRGPARGLLWVVGSCTHGCWLGSYESHKQRRFAAAMRPGMTVYDAGAHAGIYTLIAARGVGPAGVVVAIEPHPGNLAALKRHIELNHLQNVRVVEGALAETEGTLHFAEGAHSSMGRVAATGSLTVHATTLKALMERHSMAPPDLIKMDIEGSEAAAIRGGLDVLRDRRPLFFLSTHGAGVRDECVRLLENAGYVVAPLGTGTAVDPNELFASPKSP